MHHFDLHNPVYDTAAKRVIASDFVTLCNNNIKLHFLAALQDKPLLFHNHLEHLNVILPENIAYVDLPKYIKALVWKLELTNSDSYNTILVYTKLTIALLLKEKWEMGKGILQSYQKTSDVTNTFSSDLVCLNLLSYRDKVWEFLSLLQIEKNKKKNSNIESDFLIAMKILQKTYKEEFEKIFFRSGIDRVSRNLSTFTYNDKKKSEEKIEGLSYHQSISYRIKDEDFTKIEETLRNKIEIDAWVSRLRDVRNKWNQQDISDLEVAASNKILSELWKYPYQLTSINGWFSPSWILESKEVYCVGFSILWHTFLSELWIKHKALSIPRHAAIEVEIWDQLYVFDATRFTKLSEMEYGEKKWKYSSIYMQGNFWNYATSSETETWLMSHIYSNYWAWLRANLNFENSHAALDRAIELNENNSTPHILKACTFIWEDNYEESLGSLNASINLFPYDSSAYRIKGSSYFSLCKQSNAHQMLKKAFKIDPKNAAVYYEKARILFHEWNYSQAHDFILRALSYQPDYSWNYHLLWSILKLLWKENTSVFYKNIAAVIWKEALSSDLFQGNIAAKIDSYISEEKFNDFRDYLFELEQTTFG